MVNEESTVHAVANYSIQMRPTSYYGFSLAPLPSKILCSQSKCKAILPAGYNFKTCDQCHTISKLSMQKKRKREDADEGPHCQQATNLLITSNTPQTPSQPSIISILLLKDHP